MRKKGMKRTGKDAATTEKAGGERHGNYGINKVPKYDMGEKKIRTEVDTRRERSWGVGFWEKPGCTCCREVWIKTRECSDHPTILGGTGLRTFE